LSISYGDSLVLIYPPEWMQNRSAKNPDDANAQQEPHSPYSSISPIHSGALSNQLK